MLVELGLGDAHRLLEVLVGQLRVEDLVAVLRQERRLDPAWDRLPAVEEEGFHGVVVACCRRLALHGPSPKRLEAGPACTPRPGSVTTASIK